MTNEQNAVKPRKHDLQNAQKLFQQLINGEIPIDSVGQHIEAIKVKLVDAYTYTKGGGPKDVTPYLKDLMDGKSSEEVQAILDKAQADATRRINIIKARWVIEREKKEGRKLYVSEKDFSDDWKMLLVFEKAGIDTSLFENGGTPTIAQLDDLVKVAEAAIVAEDAQIRAQRPSPKR